MKRQRLFGARRQRRVFLFSPVDENVRYEETQVCLAFYFALKTVCAHGKLAEMQSKFRRIIRITAPIRDYMFAHRYDFTLAGITGIFHALYCSHCMRRDAASKR